MPFITITALGGSSNGLQTVPLFLKHLNVHWIGDLRV